MDLATLIGLAAGALLMAFAMLRGGSPRAFIDLTALGLALGGAFSSVLIHYPFARIKDSLGALKGLLSPAEEPAAAVPMLIEYAERVRKEGVLCLEAEADTARDPFMKKALELVVDGNDGDGVRDALTLDLTALEARHKQQAAVLESLAVYAPGFGMIGTLIGLVQMLGDLNDPSRLGARMAGALLATLYGVILANLLFTPLAGKVKVRGQQAVLRRELIMEGLLAILAGDGPALVASRLNSFLPPDKQVKRGYGRASRDEEA